MLQQLSGGSTPINLKAVIDEGAFLVDVRTAGEFAKRQVKGSVNIPLTTRFVNLIPNPGNLFFAKVC